MKRKLRLFNSWLYADQLDALAKQAKRESAATGERVPVAALVRRAVAEYLKREGK